MRAWYRRSNRKQDCRDWRRESALCDRHAHDALIEAIEVHDGQRAEELMRSHLVDLHSALDLRESDAASRSLKEALLGAD